MGLFNRGKASLAQAGNALTGRLDLLQAVTSLGALVMCADGEAEASEVEKLGRLIRANTTLNGAYTGAEIDTALREARAKAELGRSGRAQLWKEVRDLKGDANAELVLFLAIDVAEADGEIEQAELATLTRAANDLGLDLAALMEGSA